MDFEPTYTREQEEFRQEVQEWLKENVPSNLEHPPDPIDLTYDQYLMRRELGRRLGAKGWLWPTAPTQYSGGGLSLDHSVVIEEEMDSYGLTVPPYYDSGGRLGGPSILVWGSEEQKQHFLPMIFGGQIRTWQLLTEPEAGSDLANVQSTAIPDGDDYVINGQKVFIGSSYGCDYMWSVLRTDTEAPRHQNLGWFMIPADLPGISIVPMDLLIGGGESGAGSGTKNMIFFDNVRISKFHMVGGHNQGWKVATTHLELEHGSGGRIARNWLVDRLFDYCRSTQRRGRPLSKDQDVRDHLVDVYINAEILRLFNLRNYWMARSGTSMTYEGPQSSFVRKMSGLRMTNTVLNLLGPAALTHDAQWGAADGHVEAHQRSGIVAVHPGGTADIQKVIMARRIGIGREVKEKAGALA